MRSTAAVAFWIQFNHRFVCCFAGISLNESGLSSPSCLRLVVDRELAREVVCGSPRSSIRTRLREPDGALVRSSGRVTYEGNGQEPGGQSERSTALKVLPLKFCLSHRPIAPGPPRPGGLSRESATFSERLSATHQYSLLVDGAGWATRLALFFPEVEGSRSLTSQMMRASSALPLSAGPGVMPLVGGGEDLFTQATWRSSSHSWDGLKLCCCHAL